MKIPSWKRKIAKIPYCKPKTWTLKTHISDLRAEFGWLYESVKDFLRERAESVRALKTILGTS